MATARYPGEGVAEILEMILWDFAEKGLKPRDEALAAGNRAIVKLQTALQKKKNKIDRFIISGSYGKSTAVNQLFDIDVVAFLNNEEPSFTSVLNNFEQILDLDESLKVSDVHVTSHSIQFTLDGIAFDLLPAANFVKRNEFSSDEEALNRQRVLALAKIQSKFDKTGEYDSAYSSSLAENQVQFVKSQSSFVHSVVRLSKFWFKTLQLDYMYGGGLIIELVAVYAAQTLDRPQSHRMTRAFQKFLDLIIGFNKIEINFAKEKPRGTFTRPLILDPANPFNNIAAGVKPAAITKLIQYATETKRRLAQGGLPLLGVIFADQPHTPKAMVSTRMPEPLVDIQGDPGFNLPDMKVRKEKKFKPQELAEFRRRIEQGLVTKIQTMAGDTKGKVGAYEVQEAAVSMVERHVYGRATNWSMSYDKHEDYDVTFVIPFVNEGVKNSCWISFKI